MNPEPEENQEKDRRKREIDYYSLPEPPEHLRFTAEEIEDLKKNGIEFSEVVKILEKDMGLQDD